MKLDILIHFLLFKVNEIKHIFVVDFNEEENWILWLDGIAETEAWLKTKGFSTVELIKESLKSKVITQENFKYLNDILDNELITAKDLLTDKLTLTNIESFLNYLVECLIYVKYDLEIDKLTTVSKKEIFLHTVTETLTGFKYDLNQKKTA